MEPKLSCPQCMIRFINHKKRPRCMTEEGCPIKEVAQDKQINQICEAFLKKKQLEQFQGNERAIELVMQRCGLHEDPDLILALEGVWIEFLKQRQAQEGNGFKQ